MQRDLQIQRCAVPNGALVANGSPYVGCLCSIQSLRAAAVCWPLGAVQVVGVAAGDSTCYTLTDAGEVFAWGQGSKGQLGTGEGGMLPHDLCPCNIKGHCHMR